MSLFMGLIPAEKPELAIAVIVDEPKGAIYGGVVAAPIFREIAAQSLRFLGVYPQEKDLPVLAGMLPTHGKAKAATPAKSPPLKTASVPQPKKLRSPVPQKHLKVMPDLNGLTLRQALNMLHPTGLKCRFEGSGRAYSQEPAAGVAITPKTTCLVKFRAQF